MDRDVSQISWFFVIHWASLEAWKSIPADVLEKTESLFTEQMGGNGTYKIVEGNEYQVRKFAQIQKTRDAG